MKVVAKSEYDIVAHRAFYKYHAYHRSKSIYFMFLIGAMLLYLAITQTLEVMNSESTEGLDTQLIFVWSLVFAVSLLTPFIMASNRNNNVRKEADKRGKAIEIIELAKEKISLKIGDQGWIYVNWKNIETIREVENYIYIYTSGNQGFVITKSTIVEGSVEDVRKLAQANLTKNKKGKVAYKNHMKTVK